MFGQQSNSNGGGASSNHSLMQMQRLANMQANRNQRNNSSSFNYNQHQNSSNDPSRDNCISANDMDNSFNSMWAARSTNNNHLMDNGNNSNFGMFGGGAGQNREDRTSQMMSHAQNAATINQLTSQTYINSSGNGSPQMRAPYIFKCPECSLLKNSCDDLEIHIKTEHLNWLPFNCPLCTATRASDSQMREHIHSHHKKNDNKYFYLDNPMAKRMLQEMMDRALFSASSHAASQAARQQRNHFPNSNNSQFNNSSSSNQFCSNNSFNNGFANNQATSPTNSAEMLDRYLASTKRNRLAPGIGSINSLGRRNSNDFVKEDGMQMKAPRQENSREEDDMPMHSINNNTLGGGVTVLTKKSSTAEDLLAKLQSNSNNKDTDDSQEGQSVTEGGVLEERDLFADTMEIVDDETNNQLSQIFGNNHIKSEFDLSSMENNSNTSSLLRQTLDAANDGSDEGLQNMDVLQNVAAMFSVDSRDAGEYGQNESNNSQFIQMMRRRAPRGSKVTLQGGQCVSKKRVLGQCNKCLKPVTAGARQMHMFFHLGKDHDTYRFRCKHPKCTVEHYRKDQMENHQAKTHGKVDLDMMEDRSLELHSLCQKMSMELLGTVGNMPGPTAEKAQLLYDKMQEEAEISALRKRRRGTSGGMFNRSSSSHNYYGNNRNFLGNQYSNNFQHQSPPVKRPLNPQQRINEENLECLLCHKYIMNRIRGFHILWHLNNDLGIIRYNCKYCDFKHDRPQSVTTHGKKEHDDEHCVEDSLYRFEDEVKSMSKACFGIEQLFAKEVRRRNRLERDEKAMLAERGLLGINLNISNAPESGLEDLGDLDTNSNSNDNSNDMVQLGGSSSKNKNSSYSPKARTSGSGAANSQPASAQKNSATRKSTRRFGMRRPKSRKQKIEMAKLREISMRLGGAQYFKKKSTDSILCEKCGKFNSSRLSDHAYSHLLKCELFLCPQCNLGHQSRDMILKHLRDFHSSNEQPTDNRLKFAQEIKDAIRECYPSCFVDAPIPTAADIERLKANLNLSDKALACASFEHDVDNEEEEKGSDNGEDEDEPDDNESFNSKSNEAKSSKIEGEEDEDALDDDEERLEIQEGNAEEDEEEQEEDEEEAADEEGLEEGGIANGEDDD